MFRAHVLIIRRSKLHYTASGIFTPIGGRLVYVTVWYAGAYASVCNTDTNPTSHTETPTHIETRTHNQCDDTIEKSQDPDDGCINVRNMLSIEEVK